MTFRSWVWALIAVLAAPLANAETYKCKDVSGTVYQQVPCAPGAAQGTIAAPPPAAVEHKPAVTPDTLGVVMTLGFKRWCDSVVPGFAEQVSADWSRWRSHHLTAIRAVETDPRYLESLKKRADPGGGYTRENARFVCTPQWVRELADNRPAAAFATSPEATWRHFIEALARADREEALNCYSMQSRAKYGPVLESLTDDQLKRQAASWKLLGKGTGSEKLRQYFVQDEGRAHTIQFVNFGGRWLIIEM